MPDDDINGLGVRNYVENPRVRADHAKPLARELANAAPEDASDDERKALERIVRCSDDVESVLRDRERVSAEKLRDLRARLATQWGALESVLSGLAKIPPDAGARGAAAAALHAMLFPDGLGFVQLESTAAWGVADRRLGTVAESARREELESLVGADLVLSVELATRDLGEALGVGSTPRERGDARALSKCLTKLSRAIGSYCRLLAAKIDEEDPASIERFRRAVAPIDEYRVRRSGQEEPVEEPVASDPVVTPVAPVEPPAPAE